MEQTPESSVPSPELLAKQAQERLKRRRQRAQTGIGGREVPSPADATAEGGDSDAPEAPDTLLEADITEVDEQEQPGLLVEEQTPIYAAREKLAVASVNARRGTLNFNKAGREKALKEARKEYLAERRIVMDKELALLEDDTSDQQKAEIMAKLSNQEDGRLMGEEANYYLQKETSKLQKALERFGSYSKTTRLVMGIGAGAVVGALGAITAGGAIAGGAIAAFRVGKGYFNNEAGRTKRRTLEEKQQDSTLRVLDRKYGDQRQNEILAEMRTDHYPEQPDTEIPPEARRARVLNTINGRQRLEGVDETFKAALTEAEAEKNAKRSSLKWALGGAAVGGLLAHTVEYVYEGVSRDTPELRAPDQEGEGGDSESPPTESDIVFDGDTLEIKKDIKAADFAKLLDIPVADIDNIMQELDSADGVQNVFNSTTDMIYRDKLTGESAKRVYDVLANIKR